MISFQIKNRSVMGRNKYIQWSVCSKNIRSDKMKFHMHSKDVKYKKKTCPTCKTSMKAGNLSRHMRKHDKQLHLDLIEELERGKEKKKKDYERGVFIKNSIRNGEIDPDILTEEHHKAMKTKLPTPQVEVILRPWQERLVEVMRSRVKGRLFGLLIQLGMKVRAGFRNTLKIFTDCVYSMQI